MLVIVDYKAGNLTSVKRALDSIGIESEISAEPSVIEHAERIIFPGVGRASTAIEVLKSSGIDSALRSAFTHGTPILGICLGTQIILSRSEEGSTDCLNLISGECLKFNLPDKTIKVPHMGWNEVSVKKEHFILKDLKDGDELYFVHSFYPKPNDSENIYAVTVHGIEFASAIGYKNLFATQFHPEKSGRIGLEILENFSKWVPDVK